MAFNSAVCPFSFQGKFRKIIHYGADDQCDEYGDDCNRNFKHLKTPEGTWLGLWLGCRSVMFPWNSSFCFSCPRGPACPPESSAHDISVLSRWLLRLILTSTFIFLHNRCLTTGFNIGSTVSFGFLFLRHRVQNKPGIRVSFANCVNMSFI